MQFSANRVQVPYSTLGIRGSKSLEWGGWPEARKVLILTVMAGVAAMVASLIEFASGADLGLLKEVIMVALAAVLEAIRRFVADFSGTVEVKVEQP